ncbi:unnamed protein product [Adineta ricciae]|uniref:Uncharacterized protein n=2 Tax=Adineta ricciae TaxID=249248 RepID=A0A815UE78_ADIRI|nr:unnamed protein product [Adineta ricciae]
MDSGFASGSVFCHAESAPITDPSFWRFNIWDPAVSSTTTTQVIMARPVPAGSTHFPAVSCKLRAGNGQELIGYFLSNSGRNPAARNLPELAGIGENCAGTDSDFNGSSRRNDRPGSIIC